MTELFKTVLEMSITGAIIIAAVMLIRLCMKKLPRRYAYFLWIIPAIRLLCPFTVSSEASLFNLFPTQSVQVEYEEQFVTEQTVELPETVIPQETTSIVTVHYPDQPAQPSQPQNIVNEKQPPEEAVPSRRVSAISVVSAVWLAGVAAMLVYVASSYIRTYRRIKSAALLQNNIFISHSIDTPFVFGLIKPKIYIPDGISDTDLQYILAHENAHIKRLDHAAKLLAMVILSVHWFNPLVWLGFKLMTDDMELSCDEKALGSYDVEDRKAYATTLLNMSVRQNSLNLGGMLSFGESGIKTRIKGVLAMKKPKAIACVLAVAVIIAAAVCLLTSAKKLVVEDSERAIVTVTGTYAKHPESSSEIDSYEIAKLLNSFNVKKIDRDDIYIPDAITAYSVTIYHKNNMDYDQISFYSPAYESDNTGNDIFRFIAVDKVTIRDNQPNIELSDFYQLNDSDYDKLCKAIVPKFEAFPDGCYVSDVDSSWKVYVEYENGEPWFDIQHYNNSMMKVFPDHTDTYGLVKTETQTEMTLRYFGNGVLNIEPARTTTSFLGNFVWKGKVEDITEDDEMLQANYSSELLGSFVIEKTAIGYEAHSPLTDIYIKFTEDDNSQLFLCRKNSSGGTDEYIYDYRGGFYPHRTEIQLYDITGDGIDDLLLNKSVTGTGAVDSIFIAVDGSSMEEIPVYRIGAEKMIAEMSEEFLKDEKFEGQVYLINGYIPEMNYEYIYPYYPDTSVKRYGGMSYHFTDGKLIGIAAVGFIRNDKEHSQHHQVKFEFNYVDGTLMPSLVAAGRDNSFIGIVTENTEDNIYLVKPLESSFELDGDEQFSLRISSGNAGIKPGERFKVDYDSYMSGDEIPEQDDIKYISRTITESPMIAVTDYFFARNASGNEKNVVSENDIKIAQNDSTIAWQYSYSPLRYQNNILGDSELLEAIVDYTADGVPKSDVVIIESNQIFGFRVVDTFPYEPKSLYGTVVEVSATNKSGSRQYYIVQPEGTSNEVRVYSFAMYGDYITGDATNTFKVGDRVEVKYNGTLEYGREGDNRVFSMKAVESRPASELEICVNYLNDYWNFLFKTGEFAPEEYISDADMLALANARKLKVADTVGPDVVKAEININEKSVEVGINDDGRLWFCFIYDVNVILNDGTSATGDGVYQDYVAYFELDSDGNIFREYRLYGTEKETLGLNNTYSLPLRNTDINAVIENVFNPIKYKLHWYTSDVYKLAPDGYGLQRDEDNYIKQLGVEFLIPQDWEMEYSVASLNGEKIFEIGSPYPSEQGINYDSFKVDYGMGREITVHEEKIGTDDDPFEYFIYSSVPDYYSDDKSYDTYTYVVSSDGYNISMHFISDAGVEKEVFEYIVSTLDIGERLLVEP